MSKRTKIIIIITVLVVGFLIFRITRRGSVTPTYQTAQVEKGTLVVSVSASGQVASVNSTQITTNASGVVSHVYVKDGDTVRAGTRIASIDLDLIGKQKSSQALASYQSAKNSLDSAKVNLYTLQSKEFAANQKFINDAVARNLATYDPTYIQENADWLAAEASYSNQQAVINQAQTALGSAWMTYQQASPIIYAPITGTITGLSLQTGTIIASSQSSTGTATSTKIANITTTAKPNITLNLTEIDIPKIKVGDKATITFDAIPDKTFTGKVISIDKVGVISSNVTNYPTVLALDTNDPGILPNMAASASIITQTKDNVLMVPTTAIVNQNGQSQVRILNNNQLEFINVQTGLTSDTQIEILSGVTEGQSVVTSIITPSTSTSTTSPFSGFNRGFGGGGGGNAVRVNR